MNYCAGNYDKTIDSLEPRLKSFPNFEPAIETLATAYLAKNMNDKVVALLNPDNISPELLRQRAVLLGIAYTKLGQKKKAVAMLQIAETNVHEGLYLAYETAVLDSALNERDKALEMLELSYDRRESSIIYLNVDPLLASLRPEPRFERLLRLMNIH